MKPPSDYLKDFETKDKELFDWMNKAHEENIPIVYVSIGAECKWQDWSIKEIYNGLKAIKCKVVWGLSGDKSIPEENPDFWVRKWLP